MAETAGHRIDIEPNPGRVRVTFAGKVVADTTRAVRLLETGIPPVLYVPREDADTSLLEKTERSTHCPFKGDASYYSIRVGDRVAENAIWSYEQPIAAAEKITGHLAFYPNRVDAIQEL